MVFDSELCVVLIEKNGKSETKEGIKQPNQERIQTLVGKESDKYFGIRELKTIKQKEMKEKKLEKIPQTNEKASRNQALQEKSHKKTSG